MTSARWIGAAVPLLLLGALAALGCYTAWQATARAFNCQHPRRRGGRR